MHAGSSDKICFRHIRIRSSHVINHQFKKNPLNLAGVCTTKPIYTISITNFISFPIYILPTNKLLGAQASISASATPALLHNTLRASICFCVCLYSCVYFYLFLTCLYFFRHIYLWFIGYKN